MSNADPGSEATAAYLRDHGWTCEVARGGWCWTHPEISTTTTDALYAFTSGEAYVLEAFRQAGFVAAPSGALTHRSGFVLRSADGRVVEARGHVLWNLVALLTGLLPP